jgi:Flp pilus assembly protein TadD
VNTWRRAAAAALLVLPLLTQGAPSPDQADAALAQDGDYLAGLAALKAGEPMTAVRRLEAALLRFPEAADLHNELGFANRKLKRFDQAFEHYKRALAIDPRHRGAHEYIGEAYLLVGDLASAERHLAALRSICLLPCEELDDLRSAIATYR